jgi:transcriptional regulator with XRE-family HTH domain
MREVLVKAFAFVVRRARLRLGMTQAEFAEQFDVDVGTVSRWEHGKLRPSPAAQAKIHRIIRDDGTFDAHRLVAASPVYKWLSAMDDFNSTIVLSRGVTDALAKVGYSVDDCPQHLPTFAQNWTRRSDPEWEYSFARTAEVIEADPRWLRGEIAHIEIHAYTSVLKGWGTGLLAPIFNDGLALFESVPDPRPSREGFWMRIATDEGEEVVKSLNALVSSPSPTHRPTRLPQMDHPGNARPTIECA